MKHHTPGPWEAEGRIVEAYKKTKGHPRTVCFQVEVNADTKEQEYANARLIAAAPELLEAVQKVMSISAEMTGNGRESTFGLRLYEACEPALKKAGEPNWYERMKISIGAIK